MLNAPAGGGALLRSVILFLMVTSNPSPALELSRSKMVVYYVNLV